MKFRPKNSIQKFQMGGEMEAPEAAAPEQMPAEAAPAPEAGGQEGGDPLMQVAQLAMQALQAQDCNAAMQVCQIFLQMIQQMQGQQEPAPAGEPVFRKGGILVRRRRK